MSSPQPRQSSLKEIRDRQARLAEASALAARGEFEAAGRIVEQVLADDPQYGPALALRDRVIGAGAAAATPPSARVRASQADDRVSPASPRATLPGTNVSTDSWAQFQRRMQLRRETTCLTALRRAMDAGDYRTALDRANELAAIDAGWGQVKGFLEDLAANASAPREGQQAPAEQVAQAPAAPQPPEQAKPGPSKARRLATAETSPNGRRPQPAAARPAATIAVAQPTEARSRGRRVLVPVVVLTLLIATLAGWTAAHFLPLAAVTNWIDGSPTQEAATETPAAVTQSPATDPNATAEPPPLPLTGVIPPLPEPAPENSATENGVSQDRHTAGTPAGIGESANGLGAKPDTPTRPLTAQPSDRASSDRASSETTAPTPPPAARTQTTDTNEAASPRGAQSGTASTTVRPPQPGGATAPPLPSQAGAPTTTRDRESGIEPRTPANGNQQQPPVQQRPSTTDTRVAQNPDNATASQPPGATATLPAASPRETTSTSSPPSSPSSSSTTAPPVPVPPIPGAGESPGSVTTGTTATRRETSAPAIGGDAPPGSAGTSGAIEREREAAEQRAINLTLGAYAQAYMALNALAVKRVWPTVNEEALRNAFGQLQSQRVAFSDCTIDVRGLHAAATCTGSATYVPKVGSGRRLSVSHRWEFALRKVVDMWIIEAATIK